MVQSVFDSFLVINSKALGSFPVHMLPSVNFSALAGSLPVSEPPQAILTT
jgi:hypothetical protein